MKFKVGDYVVWTSQAQGCTRTKHGMVVEVVSAGNEPNPRIRGCGFARNHESYVVNVPSKSGKSFKTYWPRVVHLKVDDSK